MGPAPEPSPNAIAMPTWPRQQDSSGPKISRNRMRKKNAPRGARGVGSPETEGGASGSAGRLGGLGATAGRVTRRLDLVGLGLGDGTGRGLGGRLGLGLRFLAATDEADRGDE